MYQRELSCCRESSAYRSSDSKVQRKKQVKETKVSYVNIPLMLCKNVVMRSDKDDMNLVLCCDVLRALRMTLYCVVSD